ncbi:MAG: hypothetical protein AB1861_27405 [Cyanobacteriota bacterium]
MLPLKLSSHLEVRAKFWKNKEAKKLRGAGAKQHAHLEKRSHTSSEKAASAGITIFGFPHSPPECFSCTKR